MGGIIGLLGDSELSIVFIIFLSIGTMVTIFWRFSIAEQKIRSNLTTMFNDSFVLAYYTQYAFVRELLQNIGIIKKLDKFIDEFIVDVDYRTNRASNFKVDKFLEDELQSIQPKKSNNNPHEFDEFYFKKTRLKFIYERYNTFRETIDESRLNAGKMIAQIRINLGDKKFASEYREYLKHARKTTYHIRRIMEGRGEFKDELDDLIWSLRTSDQIKYNFEIKLSKFRIHWALFKKLIRIYSKNDFKNDKLLETPPNTPDVITCGDYAGYVKKDFDQIYKDYETKYQNLNKFTHKPEIHRVFNCKNIPHLLIFFDGKNVTYEDIQKAECLKCKSFLFLYRKYP